MADGCSYVLWWLSKLFLKFGVGMLKMMLVPDLTSPTPYAKSCHGKEYRVQGSQRRRRMGVRGV